MVQKYKGRNFIASQAKKHKAKNSYIHNGNEAQKIKKWKRYAYFIKADRQSNKKINTEE